MADAACVAQGFFELPKNASGEREEISVPRLEGSISFGRYMSESLEWGKWSSFHQNRHVEEAEKYSKPGSVAQKKAYFEAHHKRRIEAQKAEALLEQANAVTSSGPVEESCEGGHHESGDARSVYDELSETPLAQSPIGATVNVAVQEGDTDVSVLACSPNDSCSNEHDSWKLKIEQEGHVLEDHTVVELASRILSSHPPNNSSSGREAHESVKSEEKHIEVENHIPAGDPSRLISTETVGHVENQDAMTDAKPIRTREPVKPPLQESFAANREISASKEKKQKVLASKWSIFGRTSMASPSPVNPETRSPNLNINNKKSSTDMKDRKISAPKSLHMSISLSSPKACETTASIIKRSPINEKIEDSRLAFRPSKASPKTPHRESPLITSTTVSAAGVPKVVSLTPPSDAKSTRMASQKTDLKAKKKINAMCQSVSTECWKSSSSSWKRSSQIVCSPFSFRCEERAEKRKEFFLKLEEKLNAEKLQRQEKDKEMAENELKRLREGLGFKARPMPDFYRKTQPQKDDLKKIPPTQAQAPRLGRKVNPLEVPMTNCLPSLRSSSRKTECVNATEKSTRKLSNSSGLVSGKRRPFNIHATKL